MPKVLKKTTKSKKSVTGAVFYKRPLFLFLLCFGFLLIIAGAVYFIFRQKSEFSALKDDNQNLEWHIDDLNTQIYDLTQQNEELKNENDLLQDEVDSLYDDIRDITSTTSTVYVPSINDTCGGLPSVDLAINDKEAFDIAMAEHKTCTDKWFTTYDN